MARVRETDKRQESRERDIKGKRNRMRERERWGLSGYHATKMEKRVRMLWRRHSSLRGEDSMEQKPNTVHCLLKT